MAAGSWCQSISMASLHWYVCAFSFVQMWLLTARNWRVSKWEAKAAPNPSKPGLTVVSPKRKWTAWKSECLMLPVFVSLSLSPPQNFLFWTRLVDFGSSAWTSGPILEVTDSFWTRAALGQCNMHVSLITHTDMDLRSPHPSRPRPFLPSCLAVTWLALLKLAVARLWPSCCQCSDTLWTNHHWKRMMAH